MTVNVTQLSKLKRETTPGGGTFQDVPQCITITPPVHQKKFFEVYTHDSADPVSLGGSNEVMEVEGQIAFDPANTIHQGFKTDYDSNQVRKFQIVLPDTGNYMMEFSASVAKWNIDELPADGKELTASFTLRITGSVTVTI